MQLYHKSAYFIRSLFVLFVIIIIKSLLPSCTFSEKDQSAFSSWQEAQAKGKGTLKALYVPAEGFAYKDNEGNLTGVTVELLRGFSKFVYNKYDVELDICFAEEQDWSVFYRRVAEGSDGLIGFGNVTITQERRVELGFSPSYMTNIACLITHKKMPELNSFEEIAEKFNSMTALAFAGTLHEERLKKIVSKYFPEASVKNAHSNEEILKRVAADDGYFAYIDLYNFQRAVDRGKPLKRHKTADEAAEQFGYIMPLSTTWEEVINEYFEYDGGLTNSAFYKDIMTEHLGKDLAKVLIEANAGL